MARLKPKYIDHPVYECYSSHDVNGNVVGYFVTLYFIFEQSKCYSYVITSRDDWLDQINMMHECGEDIFYFHKDVLVTPLCLNSIYNDIHNYVSDSVTH